MVETPKRHLMGLICPNAKLNHMSCQPNHSIRAYLTRWKMAWVLKTIRNNAVVATVCFWCDGQTVLHGSRTTALGRFKEIGDVGRRCNFELETAVLYSRHCFATWCAPTTALGPKQTLPAFAAQVGKEAYLTDVRRRTAGCDQSVL